MERKKLMLACAVIIIAVLAVIGTVIFALNRNTELPSANPKQATLTGNLTCLRHKGVKPGDAVTLECAIGLLTKDQRYYSLQDLPQGASMTGFDKTVEVSGELSLPGTDERYDIAGALKVSSFTVK
jgi:hypothetical protein